MLSSALPIIVRNRTISLLLSKICPATHWIPNIIKAFQEEYPNVDYELLLGAYEDIEGWISEGRVDFGFTRLPTKKSFDCVEIARDEQMVISRCRDIPGIGAE